MSTIKPTQEPPAEPPKAPRQRKKAQELAWLYRQLAANYAPITPRDDTTAGARGAGSQTASTEAEPAPQAPNFWNDRLVEFQRRKAAAGAQTRGPRGMAVPGGPNWETLGPAGVERGQAMGRPMVSGRVSGIAIAPGGQRIYVATANGGVWRSDDAGQSWVATMDSVDIDPTNFASASQVCGAIAIDHDDPDRVYVGTGEGDTHLLFMKRVTNALPAYRGIGPIRSDDGGVTWHLEPTTTASPMLAGAAFFALAVDPANREHVIAATTKGLYQRIAGPGGAFQWQIRQAGIFSSVVVAHAAGVTTFYAAAMNRRVYHSNDGITWTATGTDFPQRVGRIALAVQRHNPAVLYALVTTPAGKLKGLYRLDNGAGAWKVVAGAPDALLTSGQGNYDLALALDPVDVNRLYLGGDTQKVVLFFQAMWCSSIYRCQVTTNGAAFTLTATYIGAPVHADVHVLTHAPNNAQSLWVGCDGGVFVNTNAPQTANFVNRNHGLTTLCCNFLAQHPTQRAIIYCGLQDNGTAQRSAAGQWKHIQGGDGGYCVVNWAAPQKVLVFANGTVYRATDGGQDYTSWQSFKVDWHLMTEPLVSAPYNPAAPAEADLVAFAAGQTIYFSTDFGESWPNTLTVPTGQVFALTFASATRLFAGTTTGEVYRIDQQPVTRQWSLIRLDNSAPAPLPLTALIADIAIDWADTTLNSIYIALAGVGDARHVWHFNGSQWRERSGSFDTSLLDVEHNALVVDRTAPANLYVGADIGVWHSADQGASWQPLSNGLPDSPVFDLQIHPTLRLLRASTHGRGIFEYQLP